MNEAAETVDGILDAAARRGNLLKRYRCALIQFPGTNHVADERHRSVMLASLQHVQQWVSR